MAGAHLRPFAADAAVVKPVAPAPRAGRALDFAYWEWGDPAGVPVLLAHATGFHARCWDAVCRLLGDGTRAIAVDLRGHGRSIKSPQPGSARGMPLAWKEEPFGWDRFGTDLAAFTEALDLRGVVGVGHSMGGHAVIQAAGRHPERFAKLLLVDPVVFSPAQCAEWSAGFASAAQHPVARRRNAWRSPQEMFERFVRRDPFRLWRPDVLMDYCRHGLRPVNDGFVLACPPLVEAAIYMGSGGHDVGDVIAKLPHPVVVLRARAGKRQPGVLDFSASPTWPELAAAFPNGRDVYLPELTHFIPMQRPDLVAAHILELLA